MYTKWSSWQTMRSERRPSLSLSHVVLQHGYWQLKHWELSECLHRMVQLSSGSLVDLPSSRSCDPWNTDCVWFFSNAVKLQISYSWIMSITWMMMNNINSSWILISLFGWQVLIKSILCVRDFGKYLVLGWILMLCTYLSIGYCTMLRLRCFRNLRDVT